MSLTDDWKARRLKNGWYYVQCKNDEIAPDLWMDDEWSAFSIDVEEVLAPCDYEELQDLKESCNQLKHNDGTQRQYVIIEEKKEYLSIFENNKRYKCMHEKYGDRELFDFEIKKIGIYGVTHEFINDCEVRND